MFRRIFTLIFVTLATTSINASVHNTVVADSENHLPLPSASVYDCRGKAIGVTDVNGNMPPVADDKYPIMVRYLGFKDRTIPHAGNDTIFMVEETSELDEVTVESRKRPILHILGYVREYSTLSTYSDTVFLFREKMVDYMLTPDKKIRFDGWTTPRTLTSKSYYHFTNSAGRDSVGDRNNQHFSWSDWMSIPHPARLPESFKKTGNVTDTLMGRHFPSVIWTKDSDNISVEVDILTDSTLRKWVPEFSGFFRRGVEFERFTTGYDYFNNDCDSVTPLDLKGYKFQIDSRGRGHDMFQFNSVYEPFFVSTRGEVYILDREYISIKDAKKWMKWNFDINQVGLYKPSDAPDPPADILALVDRVNALNPDEVRLDFTPDQNLVSKFDSRKNFTFGQRALNVLKMITGITAYKTNKNTKNVWTKAKRKQLEKIREKNKTAARNK